MVKVITQTDIMKFSGTNMAVFPLGTIVTPAARDWASEHGIRIVIGEDSVVKLEVVGKENITNERTELLRQTVKAVISNMERAGGFMKKEEIAETVAKCLQRLGCTIE